MIFRTRNFSLQHDALLGSVKLPVDYKPGSVIEVDMGDIKRNSPCITDFVFKSDETKITGVDGSCGCMNNSKVLPIDDGTQRIHVEYDSSRIGVIDTGLFEKVLVAKLDNGEKIRFKIIINESK